MEDKENESHYVNNKEFYSEMTEWKKLVDEASDVGEERPAITTYIAECFIKIAERLSHRANFINYPYREEMVGDGIENCLMYAHNFNPEKSKNPFSYFTQIIYYAFLRRIEKEKKQSFIKFKLLEREQDAGVATWFKENYFEKDKLKDAYASHFNLSDSDLKRFEPKKRKKKNKSSLENHLEDDKSEDSDS